jgi:hypothetical protein
MAEQVEQLPPDTTPETQAPQALAGWETIRFAIDHLLVRDLLAVQRLNADTRRVLARGRG